MQALVDVKDRAEATRIRRALTDPQVRAFVNVVGELVALSSDRARARVLRYVADQLAEERDAEGHR